MIARVVPATSFDQLEVPLAVVTLDLATERTRVVDAGPLRTALLASAAIPGVFEAVDVGGRAMVDGGMLAHVPVRQALDRGRRRRWCSTAPSRPLRPSAPAWATC